VAATAGFDVTLTDARPEALAAALNKVRENLDGGVERKKISADDAAAALSRLHAEPDLVAAVAKADW